MGDFFPQASPLVVFLAGLAVWWLVRSARRRRLLEERVSQLQRRVYLLEQEAKTLPGLAERLSALEQAAQRAVGQPVAKEYLDRAPGAVLPLRSESIDLKQKKESRAEPFAIPRSPTLPQVSEPHRVEPPQPAPPAASFAKPEPAVLPYPKSLLNLEEALGTNWLNKLGIIIFVTGVALFLAYELHALGPAGKIAVGYVTGALVLGAGVFFETREPYRILARAGMGGGWALLFFTTYAMYHVPASRVLSSQAVDLVLLLLVASLMVAHTLRYRSQAVTGLAFLLAFSTVTISHVSVYSLTASAILALGLVVIVLRMRWFELEIFGILACYLNHYVWLRPIIEPMDGQHHPFPAFTASTGLLILYWAVFRASYVMRRIAKPTEERVSSAAALLNPLLLLLLMKYQSIRPEWTFWFLLFLGATELMLGQLPAMRRRRTAFVVLSTLGVVLLVSSFPFRYSGEGLSVLWLMESEAFFLAGVFSREVLFRRLGALAGLLVAWQMLAVDAAPIFETRWGGGHAVSELHLGIVFAIAGLMFYANAYWLSRLRAVEAADETSGVLMEWVAYAGVVMTVVGAWLFWPEAWTAVAWAALALALAYSGGRLKINSLLLQSHAVAVMAIIRALTQNLYFTIIHHHVPVRLTTIPILSALLYLLSRWSGPADWMRRLSTSYTWTASALLALLAWCELGPDTVVLGWVALGLLLFEAGMARRTRTVRTQAYVISALSFLRIFFVNLNSPGNAGEITRAVFTTLPLAFACFYIYGRLIGRDDDCLKWERHTRVAKVHSFLGILTVAALIRFEFAPNWVAPAWAGLALIAVSIARRTGQRVFLHAGLLMGTAVLFRTILHNLSLQSPVRASFWQTRLVSVSAVIALLGFALAVAIQLKPSGQVASGPSGLRYVRAAAWLDRYPEQVFFFIPFVLLTWLLAVELRHGLVTLGWGVEAVAVFAVALGLHERSFRLSGLGLLLLCVLKIAFVDVWGLAARDRYLTFIALGCALLVVSFLYSKYRDIMREYL